MRSVADTLAQVLARGPLPLHDIREAGTRLDDRLTHLPIHAVEAILEADNRFRSDSGGWGLAPDAPVAGAAPFIDDEIPLIDTHAVDRLRDFIVLDVEATRTDIAAAELIEIAALRVRDWEVVDEFSTFVAASNIPPAISTLTGIEPFHLKGAPSPAEAVADLLKFWRDLPVLGQNLSFDVGVVSRVLPIPATEQLEVLELAQVVFPAVPSRTLADLARSLDVQVATSHRALEDCRTTLAVARRLVELANSDRAGLALSRSILNTASNPWSRLLEPPSVGPTSDALLNIEAPWRKPQPSAQPVAPSAQAAFGPNGSIPRLRPDSEHRPAQEEMAATVERALTDRSRYLIEAPTGTGKTFAYLVPAVAQASQDDAPVWVSTHTKALQDQLRSDFQTLQDGGVISGSLAVLKGAENYICTRDLAAAADSMASGGAAIEVATLVNLLHESEDGELGEVTDFWLTQRDRGAADIKATLHLDPATCEGQACEYYRACPFFSARHRASQAAVVAANHALLVTQFGVDDGGASPEPRLAGLVIDEAHTLEDAATSTMTEDLDPRKLIAWLDRLRDPDHATGLLRTVGRAFGFAAKTHTNLASALSTTKRARGAVAVFADRMATYLTEFSGVPQPGGYSVSHRFRLSVDDRRFLFLEARQALFTVAELLKELTQSLRVLQEDTEDRTAASGYHTAALRRRLRAEASHGDELTGLALGLLTLKDDSYVVYSTWEAGDVGLPRLVVTRAPVDVSAVLRRIYARAPGIVATSATLRTGGTFDFMRERLAADDFRPLAVAPTFDYSQQAALILTRHLPPPRADRQAEFVEAVADTAVAAIGTAQGGTLGLFTSRERASLAFDLAQGPLGYEGLELRAQLPGISTRELAEWFRTTRDGSLFGLRSFWEGFDAPGDTLRQLLIEKIPFPSPGDPLIAARSERLEAAGRDPFYEFSVPIAALVFQQGFGRLIRKRADRGVVVLLDRRLRTGLSYQDAFLDSLPDGLPLLYPNNEPEFLTTLAETLGVEPRLDLATGVGPQRVAVDLARTTIDDPGDPRQVDQALASVLEAFGMESFRPGQEELIRNLVVDGRDGVGLLPTGAGKSLVYQAAAMCLDGVGLVISPLIALMKDQVDSLRQDRGFHWAMALYSGMSGAEREEVLDQVRTKGCRLLYMSPERLRDPAVMQALGSVRLTFVAVDEAHCVSMWGHDFRPDFLSITTAIERLPDASAVPRLALTATAPGDVLDDIIDQLALRTPYVEHRTVDRPNLHFSVVQCKNRSVKRAQLLRIVLGHPNLPGIVYCATRKDAEATATLLRNHGIASRHYHAGMEAEQRQAVQDMFMTDQTQVICATNAFGLGVDKPDIAFVVHWSLPFSLDAYFQEAGRAARDQSFDGTAVLLWAPHDGKVIKNLLSTSVPSAPEIEKLFDVIRSRPTPYATVDDLTKVTGLDEHAVRIGVHLLRRVGAVHQGLDVGARARVSIPSSQARVADRFGDVVSARVAEIRRAVATVQRGSGTVDMFELAAELGVDVSKLEDELLTLNTDEVLGYRPFLRAMDVHVLSVDWDRSAVDAQLRKLRSVAHERFEGIVAYARSRTCRREAILHYFGEDPPPCGRCDICSGLPDRIVAVDPLRYWDVHTVSKPVVDAIFGVVRDTSRFGSMPGRGSFERALLGNAAPVNDWKLPEVLTRSRFFGALAYLTPDEVKAAVDEVLRRGTIVEVERQRRDGGIYIGLDVPA